MFPNSKPCLGTYLHCKISPFPQDIPKDRPSNNDPLYLKVYVQNVKVKHVLIDEGTWMYIYTFKVVKGLGYSNFDLDPSRRIIIKEYDDGE